MATLTPDVVELVTVPNVELIEIGTWQTATGEWTWTVDDLQAAVAAYDDPAYNTPILKLGHVPIRGVEWPSVGRVENVRLNAERTTLIGDLAGVPKWLADSMPSAFPRRSIEGEFGLRTATGTKHKFALTALSLLGETEPAISTLEDVKSLYTDGGVLTASADESSGRVTLTRNATGDLPRVTPAIVVAAVSVDELREAFYETQPNGSWAWIRECYVGDDAFIIVDNDEGDLYRIPWSEADGSITFGTPAKVVIEYVPAPAGDGEPEGGLVLLSRDPIPATRKKVEASMPLTEEQLTEIGLPADATDEQVIDHLAGIAAHLALNPPAPENAPSTGLDLPEGVTVIEEATLEDLRVAAGRGSEAHETLRRQTRDAYLSDAVKAGKFPPARLEYWRSYYDRDETGAREFIDKVEASGVVPVTSLGHAGEGENTADDALYNQLFGQPAGAGGKA